jgi:hypothetical protein
MGELGVGYYWPASERQAPLYGELGLQRTWSYKVIIKTIEIRDRHTFIPAMAIQFDGTDGYLFRRAGFAVEHPYVMLTRLNDCESQYDPFQWTTARTMRNAHIYIREHFDALHDGDVVDVEFILGETNSPKISERLTVGE